MVLTGHASVLSARNQQKELLMLVGRASRAHLQERSGPSGSCVLSLLPLVSYPLPFTPPYPVCILGYCSLTVATPPHTASLVSLLYTMVIMSKNNRKRHTKPCLFFQTNDCPLSADECDFAHIIATPEQYETLKNPQATLRTKPCRFFLGGKCRDGYWCRFKHPAQIIATSKESSDLGLLEDVPELDSDKGTDDDVDVRDLDGTWKAKPEDHPKYRTRPCRNFILGKCIYGERCSYLHVLPSPKTPANANDAALAPSPVISSYFPTTPPLHRAPPSTPVNGSKGESDAEEFDTEASEIRTPVCTRFNIDGSDMQTPSTASSGFSEGPPATPLSPCAAPGVEVYGHPPMRGNMRLPPPLPLSPLSPLSAYSRAPRDYMSAKIQAHGPLSPDCLSLNMPFSQRPPISTSMYSPTSPVPLQIVHVPFAVPLFPEVPISPTQNPTRRISVNTQKSQLARVRASSQPDISIDPTSPESPLYRSKPCKYFCETGKCQKGDKCNFSHSPASPNPPSKRPSTARKDSGSTKIEKEQKTASSFDKPETRDNPKAEAKETKHKSSNFYPINWRVVGGGVKIGSEKTEQRRHSEDTSALFLRRVSFKNPFESIGERIPNSEKSGLAVAEVLKNRAHSASSILHASDQTKPLLSRKGRDKMLALSLQAYSIAKATNAVDPDTKRPANDISPVIAVQGDGGDGDKDELVDFKDEKEGIVFTSSSRQDFDGARAKSSPSSPVSTPLSLPGMIFSAESP
ncbi:hypothetical protein ACEPAH_8580 [Sanghuangporus vaninii]